MCFAAGNHRHARHDGKNAGLGKRVIHCPQLTPQQARLPTGTHANRHLAFEFENQIRLAGKRSSQPLGRVHALPQGQQVAGRGLLRLDAGQDAFQVGNPR